MSKPLAPDADQRHYWHYTKPQRFCKALATIDGYLKGITADQVIVQEESDGLLALLEYHKDLLDSGTLNEIKDTLMHACGGQISGKDLHSLAWLQESFKRDATFFGKLTNDIQRLHAIMGAISADSVLSQPELAALSAWARSKPHLHDCWPFCQLVPLLSRVLKDGHIDSAEHSELLEFFKGFDHSASPQFETDAWPTDEDKHAGPHCEHSPKIQFEGMTYCLMLTGASSLGTRKQIAKLIEQLGGIEHPRVTLDVDYLVYCKRGNAAWAYQCYGRKVETAMELRDKHEHDIQIVREIDFWNAVVEHGGAVPLKS